MKQKLDSLLHELNGIDLVLNKLEGKNNASVFDKLCANCNRVFISFCELDVRELVNANLAKTAIDFLTRLKGQVIRLKNYKEALTEYIKMSEGNILPSANQIQNQANKVADEINKNKNLTLEIEEGKAA